MPMSDDLKINFDKVGKVCKQVGEEREKMMKENNPFDTISKIAKDIVDRQDREIALKFAKCICELLKKNGVTPMIDEYNHQDVKENSVEYKYGVSITSLDFTEHDKPFERRIKKLESLRYRCHESARDSFDNGNYGILHIVTADELKNDDKVKELQCELDKTYNQLMEVEKEAQERIAELEKTRSDWADNAVEWREEFEKAEKKIRELESKLEVKDNLLKIKNGASDKNVCEVKNLSMELCDELYVESVCPRCGDDIFVKTSDQCTALHQEIKRLENELQKKEGNYVKLWWELQGAKRDISRLKGKSAKKEEMLAALMDREEFEEFCKIWERINNG